MMNPIRARALVGTAVAVVALTSVGAAAAAGSADATLANVAASTRAAPIDSAFPPPSGTVPAEWPVLVDDTRTIAIAVPPSWSQVDTVPAQNSDGTPRPWISATPNHSLFFPAAGATDTFSVPGVVYAAVALTDSVAALATSPYHEVCAAQPVQTFANATLSGHIQVFGACGGTATQIMQIAASPADGAFTAVVLLQLTGAADDAATLDGVLSSLGRHVDPAP